MNLLKIILLLVTIAIVTILALENDTSSTEMPEEEPTEIDISKPSPNVKRSIANYGYNTYDRRYKNNRYKSRPRKTRTRNRKVKPKNKKNNFKFTKLGRERKLADVDNNNPQLTIKNTNPVININFDSTNKNAKNQDLEINLEDKKQVFNSFNASYLTFGQKSKKPDDSKSKKLEPRQTKTDPQNQKYDNNKTLASNHQAFNPDSKNVKAEILTSQPEIKQLQLESHMPEYKDEDQQSSNNNTNFTSGELNPESNIYKEKLENPILRSNNFELELAKIVPENKNLYVEVKNLVSDIKSISDISKTNFTMPKVEIEKSDTSVSKIKSGVEHKIEPSSSRHNTNLEEADTPKNNQIKFETKNIEFKPLIVDTKPKRNPIESVNYKSNTTFSNFGIEIANTESGHDETKSVDEYKIESRPYPNLGEAKEKKTPGSKQNRPDLENIETIPLKADLGLKKIDLKNGNKYKNSDEINKPKTQNEQFPDIDVKTKPKEDKSPKEKEIKLENKQSFTENIRPEIKKSENPKSKQKSDFGNEKNNLANEQSKPTLQSMGSTEKPKLEPKDSNSLHTKPLSLKFKKSIAENRNKEDKIEKSDFKSLLSDLGIQTSEQQYVQNAPDLKNIKTMPLKADLGLKTIDLKNGNKYKNSDDINKLKTQNEQSQDIDVKTIPEEDNKSPEEKEIKLENNQSFTESIKPEIKKSENPKSKQKSDSNIEKKNLASEQSKPTLQNMGSTEKPKNSNSLDTKPFSSKFKKSIAENKNNGDEIEKSDFKSLLSDLGIQTSEQQYIKIGVDDPDLKKLEPSKTKGYNQDLKKPESTTLKYKISKDNFKNKETRSINIKSEPNIPQFKPKDKNLESEAKLKNPQTKFPLQQSKPEVGKREVIREHKKVETKLTKTSSAPKSSEPDYHEIVLEFGDTKHKNEKIEPRREHRQSKPDYNTEIKSVPIDKNPEAKSRRNKLGIKADDDKPKSNYDEVVLQFGTSETITKIPNPVTRTTKYKRLTEPKSKRSETKQGKSQSTKSMPKSKETRRFDKDMPKYDKDKPRFERDEPKPEYVNHQHEAGEFKTKHKESKIADGDRIPKTTNLVNKYERTDPKYKTPDKEVKAHEEHRELKSRYNKSIKELPKYDKPRFERNEPKPEYVNHQHEADKLKPKYQESKIADGDRIPKTTSLVNKYERTDPKYKTPDKEVKAHEEHRELKSRYNKSIKELPKYDKPRFERNEPKPEYVNHQHEADKLKPKYQESKIANGDRIPKTTSLVNKYERTDPKYKTPDKEVKAHEEHRELKSRYNKSIKELPKYDKPRFERKEPKPEYVNHQHEADKLKTKYQESKIADGDRIPKTTSLVNKYERTDPKYKTPDKEVKAHEEHRELKSGYNKSIKEYEKSEPNYRQSKTKNIKYDLTAPKLENRKLISRYERHRKTEADSNRARSVYKPRIKEEKDTTYVTKEGKNKRTVIKPKYKRDKKINEPEYNESKIKFAVSETKTPNSEAGFKKFEVDDSNYEKSDLEYRKVTTEKVNIDIKTVSPEPSISGTKPNEENTTQKENYFLKAIKDWF